MKSSGLDQVDYIRLFLDQKDKVPIVDPFDESNDAVSLN